MTHQSKHSVKHQFCHINYVTHRYLHRAYSSNMAQLIHECASGGLCSSAACLGKDNLRQLTVHLTPHQKITSVLQCVTCVLQCIAVCCMCVADCYSVLHVCCSVAACLGKDNLRQLTVHLNFIPRNHKCVAVCYMCVAVCCSVLHVCSGMV